MLFVCRKCCTQLLSVVEVELLAANDLVVLVALARNKYDVALASQHNGCADGLTAVGDAKHLSR